MFSNQDVFLFIYKVLLLKNKVSRLLCRKFWTFNDCLVLDKGKDMHKCSIVFI